MPFSSRVYRVLIASPSDVEEEREIAVRVIQEWNDLYSYSRKVVLLPLRWETHTAPEWGTRPQEVINRAIVDQCDLLLGIFWTRIGTPTGAAESGTLEEILRVSTAGKPIMLYFSKVGMDPELVDVAQLARLRGFKEKTQSNALTESYKSQIDFRDKLAKQLELKVREMQKADEEGQPTPLQLGFAPPVSESSTAEDIELVQVSGLAEALQAENVDDQKKIREAVETRLRAVNSYPLQLRIANTGSSGVRNLYVEMTITAPEQVEITDAARDTAGVWPSYLSLLNRHFPTEADANAVERQGFIKTAEGWSLSFEWDALQPRRDRVIRPPLIIRSTIDARIEFSAKVFADSFPEPAILNAALTIRIVEKQVDLATLVPDLQAIRAGDENKKFIFNLGASGRNRDRGIKWAV